MTTRFAPILIATLLGSTAFAPIVSAQDATTNQTGQADQCQALSQLIEENRDSLQDDWIEQANAAVEAGDEEQCATLVQEANAQLGTEGATDAQATDDAADPEAEGAAATGAAGAEGAEGTEGAGADISVTQQQQQVSVDQGAPEIMVRQGAPNVTVQMPQPVITIDMPQPEITVRMPDPNVQVQTQEPQVEVRQGEPVVTYERAEPNIEVQSEGEPQVQFNQTGEPTVRFEQQGAQQQPADAEQQPADAQQQEQPAADAQQQEQPATETQQQEQPAADAQQQGEQDVMALIIVEGQAEEAGDPQPYSADQVIGQPLVNIDGTSLGTVERLVTVGGETYVVLGADSPLSEDGQGGVVLPLEHISFIEGTLVMRGMTEAELAELQNFDGSGAEDVPADQQIEIGTR